MVNKRSELREEHLRGNNEELIGFCREARLQGRCILDFNIDACRRLKEIAVGSIAWGYGDSNKEDMVEALDPCSGVNTV